jgi:hypothetical protein
MSFHEELLQSCLPVCGSAFGNKQDGYEMCLAQARLPSLGGGAKIVGYKPSRELAVCCFDFGAMIALTYSGCDGNRVVRSAYSPFFLRIPFGVYMDAFERAFPNFMPAELLAKAHGQLLLEVMKKEIGWTFTSAEYDFNLESVSNFRRAFKEHHQRYGKLFGS